MPQVDRDPASLGGGGNRASKGLLVLAALALMAGTVALILWQFAALDNLLQPVSWLNVRDGRSVVYAYWMVLVACVIVTVLVPPRCRLLSCSGLVVLAAAAGGVAAWNTGAFAGFLMGPTSWLAAWVLGDGICRLLNVKLRRASWALSVVIGFGLLSLYVFALGRLGAIGVWTVGLPVLFAAGFGAFRLFRSLRSTRRGARAWLSRSMEWPEAVTAAVVAVTLGFALVWAAAPEIMFDAVYMKAWLPGIWADTGRITDLTNHPQLSLVGSAQLFAVPAHALGASDVGRYIQLCAEILLLFAVWSWLRPFGRGIALGAAGSIAIVPHVVWQSATAYDDLVATLAVVVCGLALMELATRSSRHAAHGAAAGLAVGAAIGVKYHLVPVLFGLLLLFVVGARSWRGALLRSVGALAGVLAMVAAPLLVRWAGTGNPLFPQLNAVFRSPYYPPINEQWNFPFAGDASLSAVPSAVLDFIRQPSIYTEAVPFGAFGLLFAWCLVWLIGGWRAVPGARLWIGAGALTFAFIVWWLQFRYLRYALPLLTLGVVVGAASVGSTLEIITRRHAAAAWATLTVAAGFAFFPSSVATFWNVPGQFPLDVVRGSESADAYVERSLPDAAILRAFNDRSSPGSRAIGAAYSRVLLTGGRDLAPAWEMEMRRGLANGTNTAIGTTEAFLVRTGYKWAIVSSDLAASRPADPVLQPFWANGVKVAEDGGYFLYRLASPPRAVRARTAGP